MTATEPEAEVGEVVVSEAEGRLCASVATWMRIAGMAYVGGGALWLLANLRLTIAVADAKSALEIGIFWVLPELLVVLAGIWLLRSGGALAGVRIGTATLATSFSNLRWHLIALACSPVLLVAQLIDWPWEVVG